MQAKPQDKVNAKADFTEKATVRVNPLLAPSTAPFQAVPFDKIQVSDFAEAVKKGIEEQNREIDAIVRQNSIPTFENTVLPYERSGKTLYNAVITLSNLESAVGDPEVMKVVSDITPLLSEHQTNILLNEPLWQRIRTVYEQKDQNLSLTAEDLRLLEEIYKDFALNGADLTGEKRDNYRSLQSELSDLQVKFSQNLTNDMKNPARRLWLKAEDLAGLPDAVKAAARQEACETLMAEQGKDNEELYLFTVFYPSYSPFMKYADRRDLRKRMYELYNTKNVGGEFDNVQILKDIANIRLEIANLLGYKSYSDYALQRVMAKNPANVYDLLGKLRDAYYPAMQRELSEITDLARETEGPDFSLEAWDYSYWSDKYKNKKYAFNDEDMRPYFGLSNTINGVFGLATKLYGYKFKSNKSIPVYHPDVEAFEVYTKSGEILGILYTDFYYRPGKGPGAWMTEYRGEYIDESGKRVVPLISLVMNFSKPNGNEPALLNPYEVETFLHEFGHALHGLSANTKYQSQSGTNVARDFVETFSQFNENYLTEKEFLDGFAKHYQTGKKMPKELIDKFVKASQYGAAYSTIRQLNFGYLDMAYHTIQQPLRASQDMGAFEDNAIASVKAFDRVEGTLISPSFGHIFSGGYASGYYGYKWSEVLDADAFAAFKETGIFNPKTSAKFLKMLQSGNTVDAEQLYEEFRGRPATIDALMIRDGIIPAKN